VRYTYYPGCSLRSTAVGFDRSTRALFRTLEIELEELEDWNCCGTTPAHSTSINLARALPLRNLVNAEKQGHDLVVPCAACYNSMKVTDALMRAGGDEAETLNEEARQILGSAYQGRIRIRHLLDVLTQQEVFDRISSAVETSLEGLPVACYYGCLLTRPPLTVSFEPNPEQPVSMEKLATAAGASPVSWTHKTECCGASLAISRPDLVLELTARILAAAQRAGARALVVACPLCFSNLDSQQHTRGDQLPVLYVTELLGLACGLPAARWLGKHLVDPSRLMPEGTALSRGQRGWSRRGG
jgi:heterodisulfide reductase subunit B2